MRREIFVNGSWHEVTDWIFRSWCGPRRIDGEPFIGPRYILGSDQHVSRSQAVTEAAR